MKLTVHVEQREPGNAVVVSPKGEITSDTYEILDRELAEILSKPVQTLVLDMEHVAFISSAGVGTIAKTKVSLAKNNAELAMVNLQPQVRKVFEIIRLLPMMQVFKNTEELDHYLGRVQRRMMGEDDCP